MRYPRLAVCLIVLFCVCLSLPRGAGAQAPREPDLTPLWTAVGEATRGQGADADTHAFHWIFVVANSGATFNPTGSQAMRDVLREFSRTKLHADSKARDTISLVPYQLNVQRDYVQKRLTAGTEQTSPNTLVGYLPPQRTDETGPGGIKYEGGHDLERAIQYVLTEIVHPEERDFLIVTIGDTDRSNPPSNAPNYPLLILDKARLDQYRALLSQHGLPAATADKDFKITVSMENSRTVNLYCSIFAPKPLQTAAFASPRPLVGPIQPGKATGSVAPRKASPQSEPAKNPGEEDLTVPAILGLLILLICGAVAMIVWRKPVLVSIAGESHRLNFGQSLLILGPNSAQQKQRAVVLSSAKFPNSPQGPLASLRNAGFSKVTVASEGICKVSKPGSSQIPLSLGITPVPQDITFKTPSESATVKIGVSKA